MSNAENAASKQRGRPFKPGQSGNPHGKPIGTRHKTTLAVETLLEGQAEAITQKAVELALAGDTVALRLCLDRIAPLRRGRMVQFTMPQIETAQDVLTALSAVIQSVADGELTPDEGATVAALLETKRRAIETIEIENRLTALEKGKTK